MTIQQLAGGSLNEEAERMAAVSSNAIETVELVAPETKGKPRTSFGKNVRRKQRGMGRRSKAPIVSGVPEVVEVSPCLVSSSTTHSQQLSELDDMDDWATSWKQVKEEGRVWGGRAAGGRGIQRVTGFSKDVVVEGVTLAYLSTELLRRTTLKLSHGHRYGLLGQNGTGKTTLLRRIASGMLPGFPVHISTLHVEQEVVGDARSALETVVAADTAAEALAAEQEQLLALLSGEGAEGGAQTDVEPLSDEEQEAVVARLSVVGCELDALAAESAESRAATILNGLGFSLARQRAPTSTLSGGMRVRVALAQALFVKPDVLLLDEPTNHLDLEGVLWLQSHLCTLSSTVLVVSHDRTFLDTVTTDIIHVHKQQLNYYAGSLEDFERVRAEQRRRMQGAEEALQRHYKHVEESIKKMESAASKNVKDHKRLSQVASRKKKILRMGMEKTLDGKKFVAQTQSNTTGNGIRIGAIASNEGGWRKGVRTRASLVEREDPAVKFNLPTALPLGNLGPIVEMREVAFSYHPNCAEEELLLRDVTLQLEMGDRLVVLGRNGCGKTTLLQLLMGELQPVRGEVWRHRNLKVAHFTQHHVEQLELTATPLQHLCALFSDKTEQQVRAQLGSYGIGSKLAVKPMAALSGGQKSRVVFAILTFCAPHLLVLDEPTNHLDFNSIDAFTTAVDAYAGAVVLVSHDQALVGGFQPEQLVEVRRGTVARVEDGFEGYCRRALQRLNRRQLRNNARCGSML